MTVFRFRSLPTRSHTKFTEWRIQKYLQRITEAFITDFKTYLTYINYTSIQERTRFASKKVPLLPLGIFMSRNKKRSTIIYFLCEYLYGFSIEVGMDS